MAKQNLGGVYANMEFKPYEFIEYPKHVPTGNGGYSVAMTAQEEQLILTRLQKDDDDAPAIPVHFVADPVKEILISRARELQIPFNPQWSKQKLEKLIQVAEAEVDQLPVEDTTEEDEDANESPEVLKERLIEEAKSLGIPANKLWGIPRLKTTIAEFKNK